MTLAAAILSTLVGLLAAAVLAVSVLLAMGNAPAGGQAALKIGLAVCVVGGLACGGGAIALMAIGRPLWAASVGALPVAALVGVYVYETLSP